MKSVLPFCTFVVLLASCTTAYKSGQTPDDVYFSPARPHDEYVRTEDRQEKYRYDEQSDDDRYLRMKVHNRRTWSDLDYYYSDPYAYNYSNGYNLYNSLYYSTPWNYYSSWNYYYNPYSNYYNYRNPYYNSYGSKGVVLNQRPPVYNHPRTFNMNVYNPPQNNNIRGSGGRKVYNGDNSGFNYNTSNGNRSNNNSGSRLRNIFSNNNSSNSNPTYNNNSATSRSDRSSNSTPPPSSNSSRSSNSSGSTNAPVRKF